MRSAAASAVVLATLLAGCERAQDDAAERIIERAVAARGRHAKVAVDRENGSITIELGEKRLRSGSKESTKP